MKAKKHCAGSYEYSAGGFTVSVYEVEPNPAYGDTKPMWIAKADWTSDIYTDPLDTKRQAVDQARKMLNEKLGGVV
jgi:hypothetical protein